MLGQDFGAQGGAGNVHQILTEFLWIFPVNTYINYSLYYWKAPPKNKDVSTSMLSGQSLRLTLSLSPAEWGEGTGVTADIRPTQDVAAQVAGEMTTATYSLSPENRDTTCIKRGTQKQQPCTACNKIH